MRNINLHLQPSAISSITELPPRRLDDLTKVRMEEMLCGFPQPKLMRVVAVFGDPENVQFAQQILDHLGETGWKTEPDVQIVAQSVAHTGVFIRMGLHNSAVIEIVVGSNS